MDSIVSSDLCCDILKCLHLLTQDDINKETMVTEGVAPHIIKLVFQDLRQMEMQDLKHESHAVPFAPTKKKGFAVVRSIPGRKIISSPIKSHSSKSDRLRYTAFLILHQLVKPKVDLMLKYMHLIQTYSFCIFFYIQNCRNTVIEQGLVPAILKDESILNSDRRISRCAAKILCLLTQPFLEFHHQSMIDQGILKAVASAIDSKDYELKHAATLIISGLVKTPSTRKSIVSSEVLEKIFSLCNLPDNSIRPPLTCIMAEVTEGGQLSEELLKLDIVPRAIKFSSLSRRNDECRTDALKCLYNLSTIEVFRKKIVTHGALGHLISASKCSTSVQKGYAVAALRLLKDETAATLIQMAMRSHIARKLVKKKRNDHQAMKSDAGQLDASLHRDVEADT